MNYDWRIHHYFVFHASITQTGLSQTHNIGNNANSGIRGFTMWKQKNSNKTLPLVSIEPVAQVSKSCMVPLP